MGNNHETELSLFYIKTAEKFYIAFSFVLIGLFAACLHSWRRLELSFRNPKRRKKRKSREDESETSGADRYGGAVGNE